MSSLVADQFPLRESYTFPGKSELRRSLLNEKSWSARLTAGTHGLPLTMELNLRHEYTIFSRHDTAALRVPRHVVLLIRVMQTSVTL